MRYSCMLFLLKYGGIKEGRMPERALVILCPVCETMFLPGFKDCKRTWMLQQIGRRDPEYGLMV